MHGLHDGLMLEDRTWKSNINKLYKEKSGNEYLNIDEFHPDIKFVHYTFATE